MDPVTLGAVIATFLIMIATFAGAALLGRKIDQEEHEIPHRLK